LILSDGCSACHLDKTTHALGPNFASFAGHDVKLADGRHVLVDERFVREALLHPTKNPIAGYDPALMLTATEHLHLSSRPEQVAALAAFIEQMGPEPG
jgi:cytochrome c oxidase subunit II